MEFLFALPLLILPFLLPLATGLMAKSFGRKFGLWFCISIPLPFIANVILLCLPDRSAQKVVRLKPVESEEVFDHLFVKKDRRILPANRYVRHRNHY